VFSRYAALVKNLRGVVLLDPREEGALGSVKWLASRFKYRNLGLPPALHTRFPELKRRPFRELAYPTEPLRELAELLAGAGLPQEVAELLVLSSSYVSPAIVVGSRFLEVLDSLALDRVLVCRDLSTQDWKLHLRIADYTTLDMYELCVEEALQALRAPGSLSELLGARAERAARDKRRYWRVACDRGRPLILYLDNLAVAAKLGVLGSGRSHPDWAAGLSVLAAVCVPAGME